jgi:hypothetical protein
VGIGTEEEGSGSTWGAHFPSDPPSRCWGDRTTGRRAAAFWGVFGANSSPSLSGESPSSFRYALNCLSFSALSTAAAAL